MNHAAPARRRHSGRIVAASATIAALSLFGLVVPAQAADNVTLNLLTINDFHGRVDANTVKFAGTIEQLRSAGGAENTLLVGAGDFVGASLFASAIADDQPTIDVLNELGLAASAVGNHEFDKGWDDLEDRIIAGGTNANWDYLGANVYYAGTETPALPAYGLYEAAGLTVGVIGAVTEETSTLVTPAGIEALSFGDPVEAINRVAEDLSDGDPLNGEADIILATLHEGAPNGGQTLEQNQAASAVFSRIVTETSAEVDAIVNGHTHQAYAWSAPIPGQAGKTRPVLQTGQYAANVGQIKMVVDRETNTVSSFTVGNVARTTVADAVLIETYPQLQAVQDIFLAATAYAATIGNQPIGTTTGDISTAIPNRALPTNQTTNRDDRAKESTLGTLVADSLLSTLSPADRGGAELALINPGGLRAELLQAPDPLLPADSPGTILYSEANNVLPFVNNLATLDLTGAQLKVVLEQQWQRDAAGAIPSRSYLALGTSTGFTYTFDASLPEGSRITSMALNGTPIDAAETYRVGTLTFLITGGDNFRGFLQGTNVRDSGLVDRDAWIAYLTANSPVSPDFRKHSASVTGLNPAAVAGTTQTLTVGSLDLTSLGAPANTSLTASFSTSPDGAGAVAVGTATVTGGAATIDVTLPLSTAGASGYLLLTAAPTGTTVVLPVAVAAPAAAVTATAKAVEYGTAPKVVVTVAAPGQTPTGAVTVTDAAGTALGTATLANGTATVTLGKTALLPGTHTLTVSYAGSQTAGAATGTVDLVVSKASSSSIGISTSIIVSKGKASKVLVLTTANGRVAVDGPVTISSGGKVIGTGVVSNGTATVSITPFTSRGLKLLTISYEGSTTVAPSSGPGLVLVL